MASTMYLDCVSFQHGSLPCHKDPSRIIRLTLARDSQETVHYSEYRIISKIRTVLL